MAGEKTEKPTEKRLDEARKKGNVAKSNDLNGAVVLIAGLFTLLATGHSTVAHVREVMMMSLAQMQDPSVVSMGGIGQVLATTGEQALLACAPVALACLVAGVAVNVVQIGKPRLSPAGIKPDPKKLNPVQGFKSIYGPNAIFEGAKSILKVGVVAAIVAMTLLPQLGTLGALVGIEPLELTGRLIDTIAGLAKRAAIAYLFIGIVDFAWQKRRHMKSLKMDKQEVKDEAKQQELPAEVKGAIRRRQLSAARARMMAAVPTADVVVTNPTHFAVALKYDGTAPAPEVVAKGQDLVALKIRDLAADHRVPVVENKPLARSLHASVEVGQQVPEELYEAVAQVLAYVYRVAASRRAVAS
jgi:flagellar biosynthetic protein FlhB